MNFVLLFKLKFSDIETKTLKCLAKIELHGICVKKELLQKLSETLKNLTGAIEKKAFSLAGRYFNFVSSNDVSKVLGKGNFQCWQFFPYFFVGGE